MATDPQRPKVVSGNFRSVDGDLGVEPKIGGVKIPPNHPILKGVSIIFTIHFGVPLFWETSICERLCCIFVASPQMFGEMKPSTGLCMAASTGITLLLRG